MKTVCVIGLGYIGLPTASLFANQGFQVKGVDAKEHVVEMVNSGRNHIQEVGLRTLVEAAISSRPALGIARTLPGRRVHYRRPHALRSQ